LVLSQEELIVGGASGVLAGKQKMANVRGMREGGGREQVFPIRAEDGM
jgi:hypothetical protein